MKRSVKRLVGGAAVVVSLAAAGAGATPAQAGYWCYDVYWGWYPCGLNFGISALGPVQSLATGLGLPSPAAVTAPVVPPPAAS